MDIQYYGANAIRITTKQADIIIDPVSDITTVKPDLKKATIILGTQEKFLPKEAGEAFIVDGPGEYEFADCSIVGFASQPHTEASGNLMATMYRVSTADFKVLITGHINNKLQEEQLENVGVVDVVVLPVGGGGYTLDGVEAAALVKTFEPKLVVPTHYQEGGLKFEVPQDELAAFVKEIGVEPSEPVEKLKLKGGSLPEQLTVQPLIRG